MDDQELNATLQSLRDAINDLRDTMNPVGGRSAKTAGNTTSSTIDLDWFNKKLKDAGTAFSDAAKANKDTFDRILKLVQDGGERAFRSLTRQEQIILQKEAAARAQNEQMSREFDKLKKVTNELTEAENLLRDATYSLRQGFQTLRDNLLTSELSNKKYNGVISTGVEGLKKLTESVGKAVGIPEVFTKAATDFIGGLTWAQLQTLEFSERLLKSKDSLGDIGATGRYTSEAILKMAEKAKYTSFTLEGWTKATKSLGPGLTALGRTVNDGVGQFSRISEITEGELERFRAMGLSQEQVTQGQADYVNLLYKSGSIITDRDRRENALNKASKEYLNTITALANITGLQRDEIKKNMEAARSLADFQLEMISLGEQRADLEKQVDSGALTGDALVAAKRQIDLLKNKEEQFGAMMDEAVNTGDMERAKLLARAIASKGLMSSPEAYYQLGPGMFDLISKVNAGGKIAEGQVTEQLDRAMTSTRRAISQQALVLDDQLKGMVGINSEFMRKYGARRGVNMPQAFQESRKDVGTSTSGESSEQIRTDFFKIQLAAQGLIDDISKKTLPDLRDTVDTFTTKINEMIEKLRGVVDKTDKPGFWTGIIAGATSLILGLGTLLAGKYGLGKLAKIFRKPPAGTGTIPGAGGPPKPTFVEKSAAEIKAMKPSERMAYMKERAAARAAAEAAQTGATGAGAAAEAAGAASKGAGAASKAAGLAKGALGKLAWPLAIGMGIVDLYGGFIADSDAEFGERLKNAGSSLINGLTFGLLGQSPEEIKALAEKQKGLTEKDIDTTEKDIDATKKLSGASSTLKEAIDRLIETIKQYGGIGVGNAAPEQSTPFTGTKKEFANKMYNTLLEKAKKAGLANPEVVAQLGTAQSVLETGWGKHLAGGNNYFGIKDFSKNATNIRKTREFVDGRYQMVDQPFRRYGSMEESAADYIKLLQNPRYAKVLQTRNREEAARLIREAGYATDPIYTEKLLELMKGLGPPGNYAQIPGGPATSTPDPQARLQKNQDAIRAAEAASANTPANVSTVNLPSVPNSNTDLLVAMVRKLDSIDSRMSSLNYIQESMLRYAKG